MMSACRPCYLSHSLTFFFCIPENVKEVDEEQATGKYY